jgi:hypothetical protein
MLNPLVVSLKSMDPGAVPLVARFVTLLLPARVKVEFPLKVRVPVVMAPVCVTFPVKLVNVTLLVPPEVTNPVPMAMLLLSVKLISVGKGVVPVCSVVTAFPAVRFKLKIAAPLRVNVGVLMAPVWLTVLPALYRVTVPAAALTAPKDRAEALCVRLILPPVEVPAKAAIVLAVLSSVIAPPAFTVIPEPDSTPADCTTEVVLALPRVPPLALIVPPVWLTDPAVTVFVDPPIASVPLLTVSTPVTFIAAPLFSVPPETVMSLLTVTNAGAVAVPPVEVRLL